MVIDGQPDDMERLAAASVAGIFGVHNLRLARIAVVAATGVGLVGLYVGAKVVFSSEDFAAAQTRAYSLDIGESCLNGTARPPVFEAREGDRIVLTVTSLYSGEVYIHGMEKEINLTPGSETRVTFTATHAGRYYLHIHGDDEEHAHAEAAVLEIQPRQLP
jgi:hypothetical protein